MRLVLKINLTLLLPVLIHKFKILLSRIYIIFIYTKYSFRAVATGFGRFHAESPTVNLAQKCFVFFGAGMVLIFWAAPAPNRNTVYIIQLKNKIA